METLTIKVKNKERLLFLYEMLSYYDFLELPKLKEEVKSNEKISDFQKLLLAAPTWSDAEYKNYTDNRTKFNQWKVN